MTDNVTAYVIDFSKVDDEGNPLEGFRETIFAKDQADLDKKIKRRISQLEKEHDVIEGHWQG